MEFRKMEAMARSSTPEEDRKKGVVQWYYNTAQLAAHFGVHRGHMAEFLRENNIAFFSLGKSKIYNLIDVLEAVEKTRGSNKDGRVNNGRGRKPCNTASARTTAVT